jgi:hypothetical protein
MLPQSLHLRGIGFLRRFVQYFPSQLKQWILALYTFFIVIDISVGNYKKGSNDNCFIRGSYTEYEQVFDSLFLFRKNPCQMRESPAPSSALLY